MTCLEALKCIEEEIEIEELENNEKGVEDDRSIERTQEIEKVLL